MAQQNESQHKPAYPESIIISMLVGAGVALLVISFFVFGVDQSPPEWGKLWMVRPLIVTPLAGAIGGAFYSLILYQTHRGFNKTLAILLSLVVYVIVLWLGTVLGLAGTMWD